MDFKTLEQLRNKLSDIRSSHLAALNFYASEDKRGFFHQPHKRSQASLSSTATCASSAVRGGLWSSANHRWGDAYAVVDRLLEGERSGAGLPANNPFSLAFIAEACLDVLQAEQAFLSRTEKSLKPEEAASIKAKLTELDHRISSTLDSDIVPKLIEHLSSHADTENPFQVRGSISIRPYPPSAYLTQLVYRVLQRNTAWLKKLTESKLDFDVNRWARSEIERQIALITTSSRIADPLQLGYAIVLQVAVRKEADVTPEDLAMRRSALELFFKHQMPSGLWPQSQPLFHYPDVGNALAFEYEMLTQLLLCKPLWNDLLDYLPKFDASVDELGRTVFLLSSKDNSVVKAWASGHHPQFSGPESWSTACVYDFAYSLDRLAAEAIRRAAFEEVGIQYVPPLRATVAKAEHFAPADKFLDARIHIDGDDRSLRETIRDRLIAPILEERDIVAAGGQFSKATRMSAMLFGPPGTSKTELAKLIAKLLGWPLLMVDPSYIVQDGIDKLYARSNVLFRMIQSLEETVVFLDEFDEMGRNRANNDEMLSRFITTSMLPKLAAINDERRVVFILATNYVNNFDAAFSRGGRFDLMFQVMPPTYEEKVRKWPRLGEEIEKIQGKQKADEKAKIADFTFNEMLDIMRRLEASNYADVVSEVTAAHKKCTLQTAEGLEKKTWKKRCEEEAGRTR